MGDLKQVAVEELKDYIVDPTKAISEYEDDVFNYNSGLKTAIQVIEELLTADVVEVVRCKDCKHHQDEVPGMVWCPHVVGNWVNDNWFCADGERKEIDDA